MWYQISKKDVYCKSYLDLNSNKGISKQNFLFVCLILCYMFACPPIAINMFYVSKFQYQKFDHFVTRNKATLTCISFSETFLNGRIIILLETEQCHSYTFTNWNKYLICIRHVHWSNSVCNKAPN